jgi:acetyltransferase-like isoleucine patch superfamily enzyme
MNSEELAQLLRSLYTETDETLRDRFSRSLPFQDGMFDRWERATRLGFGKGASIYNSALVFGDVRVGEQTWIGPFAILDGSASPLVIGDYCSISSGVHIYTHDTVRWALSRGACEKRSSPVTIADCVYIGPQSIIELGVTVGSQSIIAANSFVDRDVESRAIVAGTPAKRIGTVVGAGSDIHFTFEHG